MTRRLQIALNKAGEIVSIFDVKTGKDCECFCPDPDCRQPLEAKNRNKTSNETLKAGERIAHFAHYDGSICSSAPESAIHLLAKNVLVETKTILLPSLYHMGIELHMAKKPIQFDKAEGEKEIKNDSLAIRTDVLLTKDTTELLVEFLKTHKVDSTKSDKIKALNKSCVEIDINFVEPLVNGKLNQEGLRHIFENNLEGKTWIFNTKTEILYKKEKERLENLAAENERLRILKYKKEKQEAEQKAIEETNRKIRSEEWKRSLLAKGYEFLKVYPKFEYENDYNNGRWKSRKVSKPMEENVYCPILKEKGEKNPIDIIQCIMCDYYFKEIYEDNYEKKIACGYKSKLKKA